MGFYTGSPCTLAFNLIYAGLSLAYLGLKCQLQIAMENKRCGCRVLGCCGHGHVGSPQKLNIRPETAGTRTAHCILLALHMAIASWHLGLGYIGDHAGVEHLSVGCCLVGALVPA